MLHFLCSVYVPTSSNSIYAWRGSNGTTQRRHLLIAHSIHDVVAVTALCRRLLCCHNFQYPHKVVDLEMGEFIILYYQHAPIIFIIFGFSFALFEFLPNIHCPPISDLSHLFTRYRDQYKP